MCIVDEAFVRRYLKGRTPIGTRLLVNAMVQPPQAVLREIVGVVKHIKERPDEPEAPPQLYVPIAQNTWWLASLVVQPASGSAAAIAPAVRAAFARVEPDRPLRFRTLTTIRTEATSRPRFRAVLVGAFALLALMLALVGVFGVLAYSVQQRTREFGVRIALGASAASVLRLVMSSAGGVIGTGVGHRSRLGGRPQPIDLDVPLWRAAARSDDVPPRAGGADRDRGDRRRRAGVARGARGSGRGVSKRVEQVRSVRFTRTFGGRSF